MNTFNKPLEERIQPYNSKSTISRSPYTTIFYQPKLVTFCPYYHCFSKYYTKSEISMIKLMTASLF